MASDYELPSTVGETVEIPALESDSNASSETHTVVLKDPPGSIGRKFHCERCDRWFVSAENFEKEACVPFERRR